MNKKLFNTVFTLPDYIIFAFFIAFPAVTLFFNVWLAAAEFAVAIGYTVFRFFAKKKHSEQLYNYLQSITLYLDEASKESLTRFPMPVTLLSKKCEIIWYNDLFHNILVDNKITEVFGKNFDLLVPSVTIGDEANLQKHNVVFAGKHYDLFIMRQDSSEKDTFYSVYWIDTTDTSNALTKLRSQRACIMYIVIDSFDELPSNITELQKSTFLTRVDVKVRAFVKSINGVMQKLEQDKYLVLFERQYLDTLEKSKFKILSDIREITVESVHASLSVGVGITDDSVESADTSAKTALDVALSRGGDQAVILKGEKYSFFGGNSDGTTTRKRVKVRIIAEALMAQVQAADNVFIMGHKYADLDCVGASIGLYKCARAFGKQPYIVYNPKENLAKTLYEEFLEIPEYQDVFIDVAMASRIVTDNALLIVADTHNIEYVESEKLYSLFKKVMVVDHHRKTVQNSITNTVINYHVANASSTCEMVSELCESIPAVRLTSKEANAILSGIYLDTKTFTERTGVRTFEAAAYLKRKGADTTEVKEFFKNDIESYKKQIDIIADAQVLLGKYAISVWREKPFNGIKLIASKAADEMLNINEIECAYVIYPEDDEIHISARSDAKGNVQRDMERLGGGGHRNAAGAQFEDTDVDSVYKMLVEILTNPESEEK